MSVSVRNRMSKFSASSSCKISFSLFRRPLLTFHVAMDGLLFFSCLFTDCIVFAMVSMELDLPIGTGFGSPAVGRLDSLVAVPGDAFVALYECSTLVWPPWRRASSWWPPVSALFCSFLLVWQFLLLVLVAVPSWDSALSSWSLYWGLFASFLRHSLLVFCLCHSDFGVDFVPADCCSDCAFSSFGYWHWRSAFSPQLSFL